MKQKAVHAQTHANLLEFERSQRPKETLSELIKRRVASDPITIRDKRTMWEKFRVLR